MNPGRFKKRSHDGMQRVGEGAAFGLEEGADEKGMVLQEERARLALLVVGNELEVSVVEGWC